MRPGVYIHIPFCVQRCYYCAFAVTLDPEPAWNPYMERVSREIAISGEPESPETIYFGGGTPSLVSPDAIESLMTRFPGRPSEVTIEANPATLGREKLERYRAIGVTRISLGVQSLEDEDLAKAGRLHTAREALADFESLRVAGFDNINLDLIAGLPEQRLETWIRNVDRALDLGPDHISIYMLDAEERSQWGRKGLTGVADEDFARFYLEAVDRLASAGYVHYEISNWARPGRECRHNLQYWTGVPYRGFGLGAHSYTPYRRYWNASSMTDYARRIDAGELPVVAEEQLTREMRLEEAFMLGLRRMAGFNPGRAAEELGVVLKPEWYARVGELQDAGWIEYDGSTLRLKPAGWLAATSVIAELLWPTPQSTFEATP
ncbi:MAG TPA: radical SAM family heme chaperone HemW [Terriglobia bacterium]|nr:radical SAM family heme chaperone HemW [Terriglobia bacterium]